MNQLGRILALAGALAAAFAAVAPWVTVAGLPVELGLLGTTISPLEATVSGTETPAWPFVLAVAGVAAVLAVLNLARILLVGLGLVVVLAGGGLWYYLDNVLDFETSDRSALEQTLVQAAVTAEVRLGPYLLLAGGAAILLGGLLAQVSKSTVTAAETGRL